MWCKDTTLFKINNNFAEKNKWFYTLKNKKL